MAPPKQSQKQIIKKLFIESRGGNNRVRIISLLYNTPMNTNQLSSSLALSYRTIKHHLSILMDNGLIYSISSGYASMYFLTTKMEQQLETLMQENITTPVTQ